MVNFTSIGKKLDQGATKSAELAVTAAYASYAGSLVCAEVSTRLTAAALHAAADKVDSVHAGVVAKQENQKARTAVRREYLMQFAA